MKALQLPRQHAFLHRHNDGVKKSKSTTQVLSKDKPAGAVISQLKSSVTWFNPDAPENLSVKEAIIRAAFVVTLPMLSAIDWTYGTHLLILIVPIIFYLEVTAFTLSCPIKALFSNYTHPSKYE